MILLLAIAMGAEPEVRNRFGTALIYENAQQTGSQELELYLSDTLYARLLDRPDWELELRFAGRAGIRLLDKGQLDRARVRDLSLRAQADRWQVDLGRFAPTGGMFRLVDGVQVLGEVHTNLRLGFWGGLVPDPYTTIPALRYGGGPVLTWQSPRGEFSLLGEVAGTAAGLDRLAGVIRARGELSKVLEAGGHADVQLRNGSLALADSMVWVRIDPIEALRIDVAYDGWSSLAYSVTERRDAAITRFAARSATVKGEPFNPQDATDSTTYHMASVRGRWRHEPTRFELSMGGRYRYHDTVHGRMLWGDLTGSLRGLVSGRLDLSLTQAVFHWASGPGTETSLRLWAQPDKGGDWAIDASADLVMRGGTPAWTPTVYADLFVDWMPLSGFSLSAGYAFTQSTDVDRWDTYHALSVRAGWRFDSRRHRRRSDR